LKRLKKIIRDAAKCSLKDREKHVYSASFESKINFLGQVILKLWQFVEN